MLEAMEKEVLKLYLGKYVRRCGAVGENIQDTLLLPTSSVGDHHIYIIQKTDKYVLIEHLGLFDSTSVYACRADLTPNGINCCKGRLCI